MSVNMRNYMTAEEQAQMDALLERAMARKARREEAATGSMRLQYFECQCGCMRKMSEDDKEKKKEPGEEECFEIERLLREICNFCLNHDLCQCQHHRERREKERMEQEMGELDDLPFDTCECHRNYQVGRMDMLFNLVDAGVVPLDVAASFAGMSVEDAADMLQGWIEANGMADGFGDKK